MADSITDDKASGSKADDFDISAEDNQNKQDDSADDSKDDAKATDTATSTDDSTDKKKVDDTKTPAFDPDLDDWAEKSGHEKPENDRERKLLQNLRNSSRDFTRDRQAKKTAADLQKTIKDAQKSAENDDDTVDPLEKEVKALRNDLSLERTARLQSEYFSTNGVTDEEVTTMGEILKEKADRGDMKAFEFLSDARNLGDLHDLAKIRMSKSVDSEVVEKAKLEERERLAKLSKSGSPSSTARGTTTAGKKDELAELWAEDL